MRNLLRLATALSLCGAAPALAQVTVDLRALDALPHPAAAPARPAPVIHRAEPRAGAAERPSSPAAHAAAHSSRPGGPAPAAPASTGAATPAPSSAAAAATTAVPSKPPAQTTPAASAAPPPAATLPAVPPPVASLTPIAPPPAAPTRHTAPPAPPITADAGTSAAASKSGLRLTFAKGGSDLSPASADAIKQLAKAAPSSDATTFNVQAYAAGDPDDPSVARRLSLSRAIAVRDALMADGVPSARIYLRALGSQPGNGDPLDRVDISVTGLNATPAAAQK